MNFKHIKTLIGKIMKPHPPLLNVFKIKHVIDTLKRNGKRDVQPDFLLSLFFFMALGLNMQGKLSASVITVVFNQWEAVVQINTLFN